MQYTSKGSATAVVEHEQGKQWFIPESPYALIVDDEVAILSVVMLLLEMEGYAGLGISNSQEVLPFLEYVEPEHLPTVILLDLMMPVISGYDIALNLSQHEKFACIPIVIMTADNRVQSVSAIQGATVLINKPFQIQQLLENFNLYLTMHSNSVEE
ncbi:MAG: response regulator [Ktedonobacteraceae bacterium]